MADYNELSLPEALNRLKIAESQINSDDKLKRLAVAEAALNDNDAAKTLALTLAINQKLQQEVIRLEHERMGAVSAEIDQNKLNALILQRQRDRELAFKVMKQRDDLQEENRRLREQIAANTPTAPTLHQDFASGSNSAHTYNNQHITNNVYVNSPSQPTSGAATQHELALRPAINDNASRASATSATTKAPTYSDGCGYEARGIECQRKSCKYFHAWQREKYGAIRRRLPKNAKEKDRMMRR